MERYWAAVYDAPEDDEPRERLARALSDAGDPRGEFILLQLSASRAGSLSRVDEKRAKALLKANAASWLEPLDGALVAKSVVWERGFPVAGALATRKPAEQDRSIGIPALATLRSLDLTKPNTGFVVEWLRRFLSSSPVRGLRRIDGLWRELLVDLALSEPPWALERVACLYWGGGARPGEVEALTDALDRGEGLPHLRELGLTFASIGNDPPLYGWLVSTPVGRQLRMLSMAVEVDHIARWLPALEEWGDRIALERVQFGPPSAPIVLHRTTRGWTRITGSVSVKGGESFAERVRDALRQLDTVDEVEVKGL